MDRFLWVDCFFIVVLFLIISYLFYYSGIFFFIVASLWDALVFLKSPHCDYGLYGVIISHTSPR